MHEQDYVVEVNRRFYSENGVSLAIVLGACIFGWAIMFFLPERMAYDINESLRSIPLFGALIAFIEARTPNAYDDLARIMVLFVFLTSPINFYYSFKIGCSSEFRWHFANLVRYRSDLHNFFGVIFIALLLIVMFIAIFFLFYSESPHCPGCTRNSVFFMYTSNYICVFALGFLSGFLKLYISAMRSNHP